MGGRARYPRRWIGPAAVAALIAGAASPLVGQGVGLIELAPPPVRADFEAGVEALHNFWWEEAQDRFRSVQAGAPAFSLGYWGEALAHHTNPFGHQRASVDTMRAVLGRLGSTPADRLARAANQQERAYLAALEELVADGDGERLHPAYGEAMEQVARDWPADLEARAFHARALLLKEPVWGRAEEAWDEVVRITRDVLEEDPTHPGALHYLIHALDRPDAALEGLDAAARYSEVAEGASHAVHMPSHIYMQLGMWDAVVHGNERALETSRRFVEATGRTAASLDGHAADFLVYGLLQQGRNREALAVIEEFAAHRARHETPALRWLNGHWSATYALHTGGFPGGVPARSGYPSSGEALAIGLTAVERGHLDEARVALAELEEQAADREDPVWPLAAAELRAVLLFHTGEDDDAARAVGLLRDALPLQRRMPRPNETPVPLQPPEELLAGMLFEMDRFDEAEAALDAGEARWPGRLRTRQLRARIAAARGDGEEARRHYRELLEQLQRADEGHPVLEEARTYLAAAPFDGAERLPPGELGEVREEGVGEETLLLIPCMSCRWRAFEGFMERNRDRYRMVAVTLPGFGGTPPPDLPMSSGRPLWHRNVVDALSALIDRRGLEDVVVVGHSWGGDAAVQLAAARPDRVSGLVLLDSWPVSDRSWFEEDPKGRRLQALRTVADNGPRYRELDAWQAFNGIGSTMPPDRRAAYHGWFMATHRDVVLQYWAENSLTDMNPLVAALRIPVLDVKAVAPGADRADAVAARDEMWDRNGRPAELRTVYLDDTTHHVLEHRPEEIDAAVAAYLSELANRRAGSASPSGRKPGT